jgi:hypothetical protein
MAWVHAKQNTKVGGYMPPAFFLYGTESMGKKVCVFVDGESFRHSIVDLFNQFKSYDYLPKADWAELYDFFVRQAVSESQKERVRTYWYVTDLLDFFPYSCTVYFHFRSLTLRGANKLCRL